MGSKAKLVIVGSGIVGCFAAYHLTKFGWRDIVVLDKGHPFENDGSTSHAPGGLVALSMSKLMTQMAVYTSDFLKELAPYSTEQNTYNAVGGLEVAITDARMTDLLRLHGAGDAYHVESHLLSPEATQAKVPYLNPAEVKGSLFVPKTAIIKGSHSSAALAREAEATGGARFVGNTLVTDIEVKNGHVVAVKTNNPELDRIECEQVLLCTNIWAPVLGDMLGIHLPLMAFEHQYAVSKPLPELAQFDPSKRHDEIIYPTLRELDSAMYYRQHWNSYGIGSYWHRPLMVRARELKKTAMNPWTQEDFDGPLEQAKRLMPMFKQAEFKEKFNGMFAFSVDGMPIIGESHIKGVWSAVASWITHSGGVGKSVAEWMAFGETEWDMRQAHIHRFQGFQTTPKYVETVTKKNYREIYDIVHPREPISEPRNIRHSPLRPRLEALKIVHTPFAGIELPNWFEENARLLETYEDQIPEREGWAAAHWSPIQAVEHLATRDNVALYDLTGLSIIEVAGAGAVSFVNYLCSNEMDKPAGSVIYTCWLTPKGGVKRDLAVARMADDKYWMFVGEGTVPQDLDWVQRHAPTDGSVQIRNISDSFGGIGLWGPNARTLLEKATTSDVSNEAFPYFSGQWIDIGMTRVFAMRISYAGELGWEFHVPMDATLSVWDELWEAGRPLGVIPAGMGAFDTLRIEKGYVLWGADVYTEFNPYECGLGWTVRLKKGDFIGKAACEAIKAAGITKKLTTLTMDAPDAAAFGAEPIYVNGDSIGYVTTANYGYSIGKYIALGYLPIEYTAPGTEVEIGYFGKRFKAIVVEATLYDPSMARLKA